MPAHSPSPALATPPALRVEALDALRLLAVLAVVAYHFGFHGPVSHGEHLIAMPALGWFAKYGYFGVSVFFVISGFVIAYSAHGRTAAGFAIARAARIYPTFVVCMTLTFAGLLAFGAPSFGATWTQWAANLIVASTPLGQPYMDSAYWSLVMELVFYAWVTVFIAAGLFPRHIDTIVIAWLGIAILNELTIDANWVEKVFLADDIGFFATGLLLYELHRGRRDVRLFATLSLAIGMAIFQALHKYGRLTDNADLSELLTVAGLCVASVAIVFLATRIRRFPLPANVTLAIGGLTYPFYLLHQQLGYAIFQAVAPSHVAIAVACIVLGIAALSWAIWRYIEPPMQRYTKRALTHWAERAGLMRKPQPATFSEMTSRSPLA